MHTYTHWKTNASMHIHDKSSVISNTWLFFHRRWLTVIVYQRVFCLTVWYIGIKTFLSVYPAVFRLYVCLECFFFYSMWSYKETYQKIYKCKYSLIHLQKVWINTLPATQIQWDSDSLSLAPIQNPVSSNLWLDKTLWRKYCIPESRIWMRSPPSFWQWCLASTQS